MSDALALYNPSDYDLSGATADELVKQLALVGKRRRRRRADDESSLESESDEDDDLEPPGPLDPEHCLVTGNGASGGAAGAVATFKVVCKDSKGKRVAEGGAPMMASVAPKSLGAKEVGEQIAVLIKDNGDGSYSGMYTVSARGNYELTVEINGVPTGGSPYPVFFSPPEADETASGPGLDAPPGDARAAALADATGPAATNSLAATAQEVARMLQPDLARISAATDAATAAMLAQQNSMGPAAISSGVRLPSREEKQMRTLLLWGISKSLSPEQLKQLFGFCGTVKRAEIVGVGGHYALVEYRKEEEAKAALAMEGMSVMGSTLRVELARSAVNASANLPRDGSAPFAAMQAHQLAQLQLQVMQAQGHQDSLAAQVAQMRAAAKTFALTPSQPLVANNSQSQKAAALAAAAALSKRLTGISTSYTPPEENRDRSRDRSMDRRGDLDQRGRSPGGGAGRRGPRPYSPPRKRPSGRARSASPRSRAIRLQRTDNREREAMRAQEEANRRLRARSRQRSRSPPPKRRSRSPRRQSRSPIRSSRSGRRLPSPVLPKRRSRSRRRSPSPLLRRQSPVRGCRDSRDRGRAYRDEYGVTSDRRGTRSNRDRSPIPRTRTPERCNRRSPGRVSERQRGHGNESRSSRRRDHSRDRHLTDHTTPTVANGNTAEAVVPSTAEVPDRTTAAMEAAVAGADAAAAAQEGANTGDANGIPETAEPATNGHAPEADADDGAVPCSTDTGTAKAGELGEDKRSHRKYRKREGSESISPQRSDKRSKKKKHHDKLGRDGDKKHHKHKHRKRRQEREGHSDDEAQPPGGSRLESDAATISRPTEAEPDSMSQQEKEQLQLRELALSKLDPVADGSDKGADVSQHSTQWV